MMSNIEASFAIQEDKDIVRFLRRYGKNPKYRYEVLCACRSLGTRLLKKYKLLGVLKVVKLHYNIK